MNESIGSRMDLRYLLDSCLTIAEAAGLLIMDVYRQDFDVTLKSDQSPVTQADIASHRLIKDALERLAPSLPCLSEEAALVDYEIRRHWTRYWLIDPLDGTKEFVKRNNEFTVNIALIEKHVPIIGVVHAPALDVSYLAAKGLGAERIRRGVRQPIAVRPVPERPSLAISKSHRNPELDLLLASLPPHEATSRGSSLKFCLVAEAEADCYPRTGPTSEWDTAAGQCIVEQAGGQVNTLPDWKRLRYNTKRSLLNPEFVVIGDLNFGWREKLMVKQ